MKMLVYKIFQSQNDDDVILLEKLVQWNEANEEIAKREAYNGEYTIEDDGQPEPVIVPTTEERVEALEAAVTMLCMPDMSEV